MCFPENADANSIHRRWLRADPFEKIDFVNMHPAYRTLPFQQSEQYLEEIYALYDDISAGRLQPPHDDLPYEVEPHPEFYDEPDPEFYDDYDGCY